ncbi:hypothetical protein RclHR1_00170033 [Rhizophagus clarus]|uniref:Uncharacterized protein n=1 Tax=Rhizophagus clarus TaxID=94130 RepID=A0A2Z6QWH5_9GLOM|nr:hypothetical protein RclHR1_00170033 [Rhizophagus clarus]GET00912.1 hypothetical protein RCL_jg19761.t1 [Rhizophagus clarus]
MKQEKVIILKALLNRLVESETRQKITGNSSFIKAIFQIVIWSHRLQTDVNSDLVQSSMLNLLLFTKKNALPTKGPKYDSQQSQLTIADNDGKLFKLECPRV